MAESANGRQREYFVWAGRCQEQPEVTHLSENQMEFG